MRRAFRFGFGRHRVERDVDDELAFHIETRVERLVAAGLSPDAARAEALRQFGDLASVRQDCVTLDEERDRAMERADRLAELRQDFAYALRTLIRNPGFTAVVTLTLALGIGANAAIFTMVEAIMLRPLPVRDPAELVAVGDPGRVNSLSQGSPHTDLLSYPLYRDLRERAKVFTGVLASGRTGRLDVRIDTGAAGRTPEHPRGRFVSGNYFHVLGVPAGAGRVFDGSEDAALGTAPIAVISDAYWTRRFGRDPGVLGRTITVNGAGLAIVGVARPGFDGEIVGQRTEMWIPVTMQEVLFPNHRLLADRSSNFLLLLGRLAPGATLERAEREVGTLIHDVLVEHATGGPAAAEEMRSRPILVSSGAKGFSRVRHNMRKPLATLMAGVGILLLIICANVANLMLARGVARSRELGIRLAIGAGRGRIVRQLLTESLVLAVLGAAAGLLVMVWGTRLLLLQLAGQAGGAPLDLRIGLPLLAFTAGVAVAAVLVFGLAPALRASRVNLASTIRAHARAVGDRAVSEAGRKSLGGRLLIPAQVALSLVLLVGAALLARSLASIERIDPGLDRDRLLVVDVDARGRAYEGDRLAQLTRGIVERLSRVPGVEGVTFSENGIFSGTESGTTIQVPGFTMRSAGDSTTLYDQVGPGYARTIGATLLAGRDFAERDDVRGERVALVNATFAKFYWPNESAIDRTITVNDSVRFRVVGVVADVKDHGLTDAPAKRMYVAYRQRVFGDPGSLHVLVRAADPAGAIPAVRREMAALDASLVLENMDPLSVMMSRSINDQRVLARLATGFGLLALLLAAVGLYGVMTYSVTRRTTEIGLRVALGAQRGAVIRMILGDALSLVLAGVVLGIPLALGAARLLRNQLHGVGATDPVALSVALVILLASAVAAALLPALRAARMDPLTALRAE